MSEGPFTRVGAFRSAAEFREYLSDRGIEIPLVDELAPAGESPLRQPISAGNLAIGNRFAIHPMEGWDATTDGRPTEDLLRRWRRFGSSGAKLIWGGEAFAVRHEGRANPNQLYLHQNSSRDLALLRETLMQAHREAEGTDRGLVMGLQLTHSGRFCRPSDQRRMEPRILYRHPILDRKFGLPADYPLLTDGDVRGIIDDYVRAATAAKNAGFHFVDVKHCHGYLGHEFLSAYTRAGDYGGSFENRTRFFREVVAGIRADAPGLEIGVRLSAFDFCPFRAALASEDDRGRGIPEALPREEPYLFGFGAHVREPARRYDLTETVRFLKLLRKEGCRLVNITAGSPYYNPHIQRPAAYPPSDGYQPPEDPLVGVARQVNVTAELKQQFPDLVIVGSAYTYLQEFLPHVAEAVVAAGGVDIVGLGRMVLSYPTFASDVLKRGKLVQPRSVCRTFSDCTTAPRNGLKSGCYPLDSHYKNSEDHRALVTIKQKLRKPRPDAAD